MKIYRIFVYFFGFFPLCVSGIVCVCMFVQCFVFHFGFLLLIFHFIGLYGIVNMPKLPACYIFDFLLLLLFSTFTHRTHAHPFNCRYPALNVSPNNHTHRQSRQLNVMYTTISKIHFESFTIARFVYVILFLSSLVSTQHQF